MEEEDERCSSWSSATTWIVAHGALQNTISFESPISPIEEDSDSISKDHLLLKSLSTDSGPCEITVSFGQSHEIRRVYVRSTARVYEIYYESKEQSGNEYLCTVRCSAAAKEDGMLHAYDTGEEAITENREGSTETTKLPRGLDEISSNCPASDEDGWVEVVKGPDSPLQDGKNNSLSKKIDRNTGGNIQVCYEATAEISDASPCISLTLRFLSLQTKEHVHIEEIYIYAVPVESTDSVHHINPTDNSTGSSLLNMLVPTLLQLSRAGRNSIQDRRVPEIREEPKYQDGGSDATELTSPEMWRSKMEGKTQEHSPIVTESVTTENNLSHSRVERVLDELVFRMGRLETLFLKFEENMLNPLACMATKLHQLNQKLDGLTAVSGPSKSNACSRFAAPEFTNESESSTDITKGYEASESRKKDDTSFNKISSPCCDDASDTELSPELFPDLGVMALEFSTVDDEHDKNYNDASEPEEKGCPVDKPAFSIDDALASALAGFLISTSVQPPERSRTSIFKAPDFSIEDDEDGSDGELISSSNHSPCSGVENPAINLVESNETDNIKGSDLTSCIPSQGGEVEAEHFTEWPNDSSTEATVEEIIPHDKSMNSSYDETVSEIRLLTECTNEIDMDAVEIDFTGNQLYGDQNCNESSVAIAREAKSAVINEGYEEVESINKIKESFNSAVDFELPILDVKFVSQTNKKTCSPLEALLSDNVLITEMETTDDARDCDDVTLEPKDAIVDDRFLILGDLIRENVPVRLEGEELQDPYETISNQEPFSSLI